MKKMLLISAVASAVVFAGGDIAPVEPAVDAPMASNWDFSGQLVGYTQTVDQFGEGELFGDDSTYAAAGAQLRATSKRFCDLLPLGAGIEVSAITQDSEFFGGGTGGFYEGGGNAGTQSAGITQAYLTAGLGNTSLKVGRQTLPKGLSPFAYSEGWQMFKNTFDAALLVNSDLPDTTLVYAYVAKGHNSVGGYADEANMIDLNGEDNVHMVTLQNKSIDGLTLTGTYYTAPDAVDAFWGDASFSMAGLSVGVQGGQITPEGLDGTTAFGAKVGGSVAGIKLAAAYSSTSSDDAEAASISNLLGGGIKSPLYTQMVLNNVGNHHAAANADFIKLSASAYGFGVHYGIGTGDHNVNDYNELDLTYKTKITDSTTLFAAYVMTDKGADDQDSNNFVRVWARYNF